MEKRTNHIGIKMLMSMRTDKNWDFAVVFIRGKNPIVVEKDVELKWEVTDFSILMSSVVPHPAPQREEDVQKRFSMFSYIEVSEIFAIDFYREQRIATAPEGKGIITMSPR